MHNGALRKWALALTFWLALHAASLRAQTFTAPLKASTTGTDPVDFEFRADGTLIAKGNEGVGSLLSTDQGAGTRMLWYPAVGAFRAGGTSASEWNASNLGSYSAAWGYGTIASGPYSTAFGGGTTASGDYATAFGFNTTSQAMLAVVIGQYNVGGGTGNSWVATDPLFEIGNGTSSATSDALVVYKNGNTFIGGVDNEMPNQTLVNPGSVLTEGLGDSRYVSSSNIVSGSVSVYGSVYPNISLNGGDATGIYSFAAGPASNASGEESTAIGVDAIASGTFSMAFGYGSTASGRASTALGYNSTASGEYSTAMGRSVTSQQYATAMGQSTASGGYATSMGSSTASGDFSVAMGQRSIASGYISTAMGASSSASGTYAFSLGSGSTASGVASVAMGLRSNASGDDSLTTGYSTTASGAFSVALGTQTTASAYADVVLGKFNVGAVSGGGATAWVSTDPLFEIGNGAQTAAGYWTQTTASGYYSPTPVPGWIYETASGYYVPGATTSVYTPPVIAPSDALVVYKNGNAAFQGSVQVAPSGDIPMYTGN